MKRQFISKIIAGTIISTTLFTLVPVRASAEWVIDYQNNWYYTQNNEKMTGWKRIDGQLYYFDNSGKMQTGWIKAGSSWYFLDGKGMMKTGWINYNKNLYYTDSNGVIQTGTLNIAGKIYIFDNNGVAKTSNTIINGQFYTIGLDGQVVGNIVPTPDKEFDDSGKCLTVLKNTDNKATTSPTDSKIYEVIEDQSESNDDPNEGRTFKVRFKDSNGAELKIKNVKNGKSVDLYEPTKDGSKFGSWNTKSDGSGKSYDDSDSIKVKEDIDLYAQWTEDTTIYVTNITVKGSSSVQIGKTAQMTAAILPETAGSIGVTWSITSGIGRATIDSNGLLTGVSEGAVTVKATATDGSNISGSKQVAVGQTSVLVPVTSIAVSSKTGATTITANSGTLQMSASVLPEDASDQTVTWTVENRTGSATISNTGLLTAVGNGLVTVKATDKSGIVGSSTILLSGQITKTLVDGIALSSTSESIAASGGTLQISASISPTNATNKDVTWSVDNAACATISSAGLLKAVGNGTVTITAIAKDGSGKAGTKTITVTNQVTQVTDITVAGEGGIKKLIGPNNKTLQMIATVSPTDAANIGVIWTVIKAGDTGTTMTGIATIDSDGLLTAVSNGIVTVRATSKANSKIVGSKVIEIIGQDIPVTEILVDGTSSVSTVTSDKGNLQMVATLKPTYTTQQAVTWSVEQVGDTGTTMTGKATIDNFGVLSAVANGTVNVIATSKDNPNKFGTKTITISGQLIKVDGIIVLPTTTTGAAVTITNDGGTLLMSASASPTDASDKSVTWSVENGKDLNGTGKAKIISNGKVQAYLTAEENGQVLVKATANDGSGVVGTQLIEISGQTVKVTGITVTSVDNATTIPIIGGTLKMSATVAPINAYNKAVTWSVQNVTGSATIDTDGTLHGVANGTVTVTATATDGSGITGKNTITVNGITGITITGVDTVVAGKTLQLSANVLPSTVTNKAVTWSVVNVDTTESTHAAIDDVSGKLTTLSAGTVLVTATASDGSGKNKTAIVTITAS